ncbi:MAG: hypothetical protein ACP5GZ_00125 [Vulcanisaeta sp.]|uniref:hypothetical protein n=1 Tax=Vulcanisaeta sp. TaxID=2020871 RepID=UPI003D1479CC
MVSDRVYYYYDFEVLAPNGTRIGVIHVCVYTANGEATMHIELMPRNEVNEINNIRPAQYTA